MSGAEIAAEVADAIAEAGADTGDGTPLVAQILRRTGPDESGYPVLNKGSVTSYACTVVLVGYASRDRQGTQIEAQDVKMLISPDAEIAPQNDDKVRVQGEEFHIVNVEATKPGGTVLMWKCQARRSDQSG